MDEKRCAKCLEVKPLEGFHRNSRGLLGRASYCRACKKVIARNWYANHRESHNATVAEYQRRRQDVSWWWKRGNRYNITFDQYHVILASQGGRCALCGQEEIAVDSRSGKTKRLCIDHDHATGAVRGLLCTRCNSAIGLLRESTVLFASAVVYLSGGRIVHAQQAEDARAVA